MKGAKGGKRDRDISYKYHIKNTTKESELFAETLKEQDERIYEDKVKSLEHEDVFVSPLADEETDTDVFLEPSDKVKVVEDVKIEKNEDLLKKKKEKEEIIENNRKIKLEEVEEEIPIVNSDENISVEEEIEDKLLEDIDKEEAYIFYELEKAVKEDLYDLEDIEYRIGVIDDKIESESLKDEVDNLKRELDVLLEKFKKIKSKYKDFDFDIHPDWDDSYIETLISSYGDSIKSDNKVSSLIDCIEETKSYIGIIETVAYTENRIKDLDENVNDKYKELDIRDNNLLLLEDNLQDVELVKDKVDDIVKDIDDDLKIIKEKIDNSLNIDTYYKTIRETVSRMDRVVAATLLMATASFMPKGFGGKLLKAGLIAGAIHNLAHTVEYKEHKEQKTYVSFTDYSADIMENFKNIKHVSYMIDVAFKDIDTIRYKFNNEFSKYIDIIPECKSLLENLDEIETELEKQKYLIDKYNNETKSYLRENEEKKYIKEYDNK